MYKVFVRFVSKCFPRHTLCFLLPELLQYGFSFETLFHLGIDYPELYSLLCEEGITLSDYRFRTCVRPNTFS